MCNAFSSTLYLWALALGSHHSYADCVEKRKYNLKACVCPKDIQKLQSASVWGSIGLLTTKVAEAEFWSDSLWENSVVDLEGDGDERGRGSGQSALHHSIPGRQQPVLRCHLCPYTSTIIGNLKRHLRIHTGEKPFKCDVCSEEFGVKEHCLLHIRRRHTGEKPYMCSLCSFVTAQSSALSRHMLTHTGEKRFACSACSYLCSRREQLRNHMSRRHKHTTADR